MGLFYVGFGIGNIFLTPLGTRMGPRRSLVVIVLLWSLFTALGAVASQVLMIFMASRVLLGLSEGIQPPMMNQLTNTWFAPDERSRANSTFVAGLFLAILTAPIVLVPIMERYGWRSGFYVLAIGGIVISLPLVLRYVHDNPRAHPRVDDALARDLEHGAGIIDVDETPTWHLLFERPFQLMLATGIINALVALGFASWLPTYLSQLEGVAYGDLAWLAAIPYGASLLGLATWAILGDRTDRRSAPRLPGLVCISDRARAPPAGDHRPGDPAAGRFDHQGRFRRLERPSVLRHRARPDRRGQGPARSRLHAGDP